MTMASVNGSTTLLIRISNAWDALRGRPCTHTVDAMSIELNVDTSKLEEGLERTKARLAELTGLVEAANKLPSPPLMLKVDKKLSSEARARLRECFNEAAKPGKMVVLEQGMTLIQLVDGKWQPIDGSKAEPLTEDEVRIAEGWTKEQVVTECGIVEEWREPADLQMEILKAGTMTADEICRLENNV